MFIIHYGLVLPLVNHTQAMNQRSCTVGWIEWLWCRMAPLIDQCLAMEDLDLRLLVLPYCQWAWRVECDPHHLCLKTTALYWLQWLLHWVQKWQWRVVDRLWQSRLLLVEGRTVLISKHLHMRAVRSRPLLAISLQ